MELQTQFQYTLLIDHRGESSLDARLIEYRIESSYKPFLSGRIYRAKADSIRTLQHELARRRKIDYTMRLISSFTLSEVQVGAALRMCAHTSWVAIFP